MSRIFLTRSSGLIGRYLIHGLCEKGHPVAMLSRGAAGERDGVRFFHWDVKRVGENMGAGRWSKKRRIRE